MKSLLFLLFPILIFAQDSYKDTLHLSQGKSYPCLITNLNESNVQVVYSNNRNESLILKAVKSIYLEEHGIIYSNDGFTKDVGLLSDFIEKRMEKIKKAQLIKNEQENFAVNLTFNPNEDLKNNPLNNIQIQNNEYKKWSFGVLYVPYNSVLVYSLEESYYQSQPSIFGRVVNETNMEVQLSYAVMDILRLTFDVSYTSTNYERRDEIHSRNTTGDYRSDWGNLIKEDLTLFDFNIGAKLYLNNFISEKVSVYLLAGIGKQIAAADFEDKNLFPIPNPSVISSENNLNEFTKDVNSPLHYNVGFGAEYFFNESLSLTSNIRFIYSMISAEYRSGTLKQMEAIAKTTDYEKSNFITRVGLGLNFYF